MEAYNQFAAWVQILRGGFSGSGWFYQQYTFKVKKYLPTPPWYSNEQFSPAAHAGPYQYIIVHNESASRPIFPPNERDFRLVRREGSFSFYARSSEPVAP